MQGILDAFIKAFRIANELGDEEEVTTPDLINSLNHIDDIYIDTVEIYEDGFEMIEQKVPLGDASKCVRNLLIRVNKSIKRQSIQLPFLVCRTSAILK